MRTTLWPEGSAAKCVRLHLSRRVSQDWTEDPRREHGLREEAAAVQRLPAALNRGILDEIDSFPLQRLDLPK